MLEKGKSLSDEAVFICFFFQPPGLIEAGRVELNKILLPGVGMGFEVDFLRQKSTLKVAL